MIMSNGSYTYTYEPSFFGQPWGALTRSDGACIPCNPANMEFCYYLYWVQQGGTAPSGAPTPTNFPGCAINPAAT
jgi:hypothetical protein